MKRMLRAAVLVLLMGLVFSPAVLADTPVKVMINGEYVELEQLPRWTEGVDRDGDVISSVMVPFRPVMERLGAVVEWQNGTATARRADETVAVTVGQPEATVTVEGKEPRAVEMDIAPFVENESTYVEVYTVADALNGVECGIDFGEDEDTVVFVDFNDVFASANEDFSLLKAAAETGSADPEKCYRGEGSFNVTATGHESFLWSEGTKVGVSGDMQAVQQGNSAEADIHLTMDLDALVAGEEMDEEDAALLQALKDMNMTLLVNGNTGDVYMKSDELAALMMGMELDRDMWLKTNGFDTYAEMGIDMTDILELSKGKPSIDLKEVMVGVVSSSTYPDVGTYDKAVTLYALMKDLLGDQAFSVRPFGGETIYSITVTGETILNVLAKYVDADGALRAEAEPLDMEALHSVRLDLMLSEHEGEIVQARTDFQLDTDELKTEVHTETAGSSDTLSSKLYASVDVADLGRLDMAAASKMQETAEDFTLKVPDEKDVLDINTLTGAGVIGGEDGPTDVFMSDGLDEEGEDLEGYEDYDWDADYDWETDESLDGDMDWEGEDWDEEDWDEEDWTEEDDDLLIQLYKALLEIGVTDMQPVG